MMNPKVKSFVISGLRRLSYRWPGRYLALKASNRGRNQYVCAMCPEGTLHPRKAIQLDHIVPIVDPIIGWTNFDDFITRMFVEQDGFQSLCRTHHAEKTLHENSIRKANKPIKPKKTLTKSKKSSKLKE